MNTGSATPDPAPDRAGAEPTFGARFLAELRSRGGSLSSFSYAEIQRIKACDREGLVAALRAAQPLVSYAAIQCIRTIESPEELARVVRQQQQVQAAAAAAGLFMMIAMLG